MLVWHDPNTFWLSLLLIVAARFNDAFLLYRCLARMFGSGDCVGVRVGFDRQQHANGQALGMGQIKMTPLFQPRMAALERGRYNAIIP